MSKNNQQKIGKILEYMLSVSPDEFLLVPDKNGYYSFREVLKALSEKKDLSWITKGKIFSWLNLEQNSLIEICGANLIRYNGNNNRRLPEKTENLPGEIYTAIRRKAWAGVSEKGLKYQDKQIILFASKENALIKGKRSDPDPVILFVSTKIALLKGVSFEKFTEGIFLADRLEPGMFKGPSVDKTIVKIKQKKTDESKSFKPPGTFSVFPEDVFPEYKNSGKDSWKKNKKKLRRQKNRLWPDENR